jgi:hypothetical protein
MIRLAEETVNSNPDKQWHSNELLKIIFARRPHLRGKVDHYILNYLLKKSDSVKYLNRSIWVSTASPEEIQASRLQVEDLIVLALQDIGRPATTNEIKKWVASYRDVGRFFQIHPTKAVVSVGRGEYGLMKRDVICNFPVDEIVDLLISECRKNEGMLSSDELEGIALEYELGKGVNASVLCSFASVSERLQSTYDQEVKLSSPERA